MSDISMAAILRDGAALAVTYRRLLELRLSQAAGPDGRALAHALADMMIAGEYAMGWPLVDALTALDALGVGRCTRTAELRRRLADLAQRIAAFEYDGTAQEAA